MTDSDSDSPPPSSSSGSSMESDLLPHEKILSGETWQQCVRRCNYKRCSMKEAHEYLLEQIGLKKEQDEQEAGSADLIIAQIRSSFDRPLPPPLRNHQFKPENQGLIEQERVEYSPEIYDPIPMPERDPNLDIQMEDIQKVYVKNALDTLEDIKPDDEACYYVDLLYARKASVECRDAADKLENLKLEKLKLVIGFEKIQLQISRKLDEDYETTITYGRSEEGLHLMEFENTFFQDGTHYKIMAAVDFFFFLRIPGQFLNQISIEFEEYRSEQQPPQFIDMSILGVIAKLFKERLGDRKILVRNFKYMFNRGDDYLEPKKSYFHEFLQVLWPQKLRHLVLRMWDDKEVLASGSYDPVILNWPRYSVASSLEQWRDARTLDICDPLMCKYWISLLEIRNIKVLSMTAADLKKAQSVSRNYTITLTEPLRIEDVKEAFKGASGTFDKDPESPEFGFPLKLTRDHHEDTLIVITIESNKVDMDYKYLSQSSIQQN
ncbi:hypothetical protein L3Y34_003166 [Caenorhabditis briggsae]|uniref:DUF38 domain-containing protein n=1 Tax=Caenorhabditis briggsae TaxID=6238 RepID=A0AAE9AEV8_CAEBR|nr:hypothetical protein L3Y34_003166 [Caenorhabditis briggsae]